MNKDLIPSNLHNLVPLAEKCGMVDDNNTEYLYPKDCLNIIILFFKSFANDFKGFIQYGN
jgi:hypothetical protein